MKKLRSFLSVTFCTLLLLSGGWASASHLVGMDLKYTHITGNTYKITLIAYGNCGSNTGSGSAYSTLPTSTPTVYVLNGASLVATLTLAIEAPSAGTEITPVCPSELASTQCTDVTYAIPGIKRFTYSTTYTLPTTSQYWRFLFTGALGASSAGRAAAITNLTGPGSTLIQLIDTLNNQYAPNNSPNLTIVPTPFFCNLNADNYNPGAIDADGDSLNFQLAPAMNGSLTSTPGGMCGYVAPYTPTNPLQVTTMTFNTTNGQISFFPNGLQRSVVVYNIEEHRGDTLVGTSQREMTFTVLTCTNTPASGVLTGATNGVIDSGTHFHICQNTGPFTVHINPTEPNPTNNITVTYSGLPAGATFTITNNTTPTPLCGFNWTSTGVAPGTYTFYVTYTDNNCPLSGVQTLAYNIQINPQPTITDSVSTVACDGKALVTIIPGTGLSQIIKVVAGPGDTILTYYDSTSVPSYTDSLGAGTYTVTLTSTAGCTNSTTFNVGTVIQPTITWNLITPVTCLGPAHFQVIGGPTGAGPWVIKVSDAPGDTIQTITGVTTTFIDSLPAGSYTITIFNAQGCNAFVSFTLAPPPPIVPTGTFTDPSYCGATDGTITLHSLWPGTTDTIKFTYNGTVQPSQVHVVAADSTVTITGLAAGLYTGITATYGHCVSSVVGPITLTNPPFTMRAIAYTNPSWCGVCDGSLTIYGLHPGQTDTLNYTLGGVAQPPVVHTIGSDSTIVISGLCAGTYASFIANTAGLCISNTLGPITLVAPPFTIRTISFVNPTWCGYCDGSITLYGLHPGDVDVITYTLNGVAQPGVTITIPADSQVHFTGLCPGVYANFIATKGSCVSNAVGPVTLTVPPFVIRAITFTNPSWCGICDGTITLYGLHPGQLDTINYTFNGVAQPPVILLIPSDSTVHLSGLCGGTYANFIATTAGVCVSNAVGPVTLTPPPFTFRALTFTNPDYCGNCNGTITLWGLHPGDIDTIKYTFGGAPQPPVIRTIGPDSTATIAGLCAGTYAGFTVYKAGGCVSNTMGPLTLTVPPFLIRALGTVNPSYCGICDGSITIFGVHPGQLDTITYNFNGVAQPPVVVFIPADSQVVLTGLCQGVYDNFVAHTGGVCVSNALGPVTLTVPPFLISYLTYTNPTKCGFCDGIIKVHGLHPGQIDTIYYSFNHVPQPGIRIVAGPDSIATIPGLCEGIYDSFVAHAAGICVSNYLGPDTLVAPPIIAGFTDVIHYGCKGDTVYFTNTSVPAADLSYRWYFGDGSTDISPNPVHIYYTSGSFTIRLIITNTRCYDSTQTTINLDNLIKAGFTTNPDSFVCQNDPVNYLNASTGTALNYLWSFGDGGTSAVANPTHSYVNSGDYTIQLAISNWVPCYDTARKTITVDTATKISVVASDSTICREGSITFTGIFASEGNTGFMWTFGDGNTVSNINPTQYTYDGTGYFNVTLQAYYRACPTVSSGFKVLVFPNPQVNLGSDTAICPGGDGIILSDQINQNNGNALWLWNTGQTTPSILVGQPGVYYVKVGVNGCESTDTVIVSNDCYMDVPNVFTPNGDGINDYFYPRQLLSKGLINFKMDIYNRWGQLIFTTNTLDGRGWDGNFNGVPQPEGVYIYVIDAQFKDAEHTHRQGNITLLR